jgi:hypothetical protein
MRIRALQRSRRFGLVQQHAVGEEPDSDDEHVAFPVSLRVMHA